MVTPEKWDVVTRKQGGGSGDAMGSLASRCRLLIVDEIHLLAEERGAVLECVVARTTRLVESDAVANTTCWIISYLTELRGCGTVLRLFL